MLTRRCSLRVASRGIVRADGLSTLSGGLRYRGSLAGHEKKLKNSRVMKMRTCAGGETVSERRPSIPFLKEAFSRALKAQMVGSNVLVNNCRRNAGRMGRPYAAGRLGITVLPAQPDGRLWCISKCAGHDENPLRGRIINLSSWRAGEERER